MVSIYLMFFISVVTKDTMIEIPNNSTASSVATFLRKSNLITSENLFLLCLKIFFSREKNQTW